MGELVTCDSWAESSDSGYNRSCNVTGILGKNYPSKLNLSHLSTQFQQYTSGTCFFIKGGKNSNSADAQGDSWEEILSAETPCLSKPWISWNAQDHKKALWQPKTISKQRLIEAQLRLESVSFLAYLFSFPFIIFSFVPRVSEEGVKRGPWEAG